MLMVALMLFCSKKITSMSGKYFVAQQKDLGKVNGYIEEMMEGQKVVKVFTHEQKALDGFRQLNDKLKESAEQANSYANIIMPVTAQLGNTSYAAVSYTHLDVYKRQASRRACFSSSVMASSVTKGPSPTQEE